MKPLVSIIVPVYNGSNYLKEALDSALAQTYDNIEIIVINDGSNDDLKTEQVALSYGEKIRYISKENGGSSSALNEGIRNMRGEYFSWLSHDDLYLPQKIEKQLEIMMKHNSEDTIVVCGGTLIDKDGNSLFSKPNKLNGLKNSSNALESLSHGKGINGCGVLISKSLIERVGYFDEKMVYLNDLDYWWRLVFKNVNVYYMTDKLVKTRIHDKQVSVLKRNMFNKERHYLANKLLTLLDDVKMDRFVAEKQVAYFCASENLRAEYIQAKRKVFATRKISLTTRIYLFSAWMYGYAKRFLTWLRKKILFGR